MVGGAEGEALTTESGLPGIPKSISVKYASVSICICIILYTHIQYSCVCLYRITFGTNCITQYLY